MTDKLSRRAPDFVPGPATATTAGATMPAVFPVVRGIIWDVALNASIPVGCYLLAKRLGASDFTALVVASVFPAAKSVWDVRRHRQADPVALLVLLGIGASAVALFFGGNQRMLLIRESFFTGAFGIACLVSLVFPRPIMYYFARYFMAGRDAERRGVFESRWQYPDARRAHRLVTAVWGVVFVGEFITRVVLVYTLRPAVVLSVAPVVMGVATIGTIVWTFRYAGRVRERIPS